MSTARSVKLAAKVSRHWLCGATFLFAIIVESTAQSAAISDFRLGTDRRFVLQYTADTNSYFILRKGEQVTALSVAKDIQWGTAGLIQLRDPDVAESTAFYRVQQVPLAAPLDTDDDGIDDVYELRNRPLLNPLSTTDAGLDPDSDGKTTLEEYRVGRNPFVAERPSVPTINYPANATTASFVMFTGQGPTNTQIRVEGGAAYVTNVVGRTGAFELTVPLNANRLNRLFVSAVDELGQSSPLAPVDIIQDSTPPYLFIDVPASNAGLTTETTLVAGRVGDALSGFLGLNVTINGQPAQVDVGIGPNGTYQRLVSLNLGMNNIVVVASDRLGNSITRRVSVVRQVPSGPRLMAVSGDEQETNILRRLAQPLVVKVTQANGIPLANKMVNLQVTRSDGRLLPVNTNQLAAAITNRADYSPNGVMLLQLNTDAKGEARAWWTMGTDAGHANNRVTVSAAEIAETAFFCASASALPPKQVNIGSGNNQRGETLGPAPEPLKVWVSDGNNPVARIPVTFRVVQGSGKLVPIVGPDGASPARPGVRGSRPTGSIALQIPNSGSSRSDETQPSPEGTRSTASPQLQSFGVPALAGPGRVNAKLQATPSSEVTVLTAITGHAEVDFTFGPDAGNQIVEATFPGNTGLPTTFVLYALARTPGLPTSFIGLIQDNTSQPIGGASCELTVAGATNVTISDAQGRFAFLNTPSGAGHLSVNGATARTLGTNSIPTNSFPSLQYSIAVVPNAENSLPTPVFLPRLNTNNARWYSGTNDLVLTCEDIEGLKMTIKANSMKHPDGQLVDPAHPAYVSLNQVHHDNIPMPMPDGASPPFAWTLQPGGATFDPPVQVEYPNMSGLAPGAAAFFLTFNHDTERFEIVASGHVLDDGSKVVTDAGAGLTISGWGANCPPYSVTADVEHVSVQIVAYCASPCVAIIPGDPLVVPPGRLITLTAQGGPQPASFAWTSDNSAVASIHGTSGSMVNIRTLQPGKATVRVALTSASGATAESTHEVYVVGVTVEKMWSDQYPGTGENSNFLPGGAGIHGNKGSYILMAARSDAAAYVQARVRVEPDVPHVRNRILIRLGTLSGSGQAITVGQETVSNTRPRIASKDARPVGEGTFQGNLASMNFQRLDVERDQIDFTIVAGIDDNSDNRLSEDELMDVNFFAVPSDRLPHYKIISADKYMGAVGFAEAGQLFGGVLLHNAGQFLDAFLDDDAPSGRLFSVEMHVQGGSINSLGLSHNVGLVFDSAGNGTVLLHQFASVSDLAAKIRQAQHYKRTIQELLLAGRVEVQSYFAQNPEVSTHRFTWEVNVGITFEEIRELHLSFGHAHLSGSVTVDVDAADGRATRLSTDMHLRDVYDWNYSHGDGVNARIASIQAGYDTLGEAGHVFAVNVALDEIRGADSVGIDTDGNPVPFYFPR